MLDGLSRAGLSTRGEPMGVDPGAMRLLMEHTWPGNDAELSGVLLRAARVAGGPVVTSADLAAIGFSPELSSSAQATTTPIPTSVRRRAAGRSVRRR
jgi:DNA-binding NtrC family response regulator